MKDLVVNILSQFLAKQFQIHGKEKPLILALSGGNDSLCLFYALLDCQKILPFQFFVAHVDHGWRDVSAKEAEILSEICQDHHIPFYEKKLKKNTLKGNLEAICRQLRMEFFKELIYKLDAKAIILGHHADDQAETILKRLLEGAHLPFLSGMQQISFFEGIELWRPFLHTSKTVLKTWLEERKIQAFQDETNLDSKYLRSRMRLAILPFLEGCFGKNVVTCLNSIAKDASELKFYLNHKIEHLLRKRIKGPLGSAYDLSALSLMDPFELKYFLRIIAAEHHFYLSKTAIETASKLILESAADKRIIVDKVEIIIDRKKIFILQKKNEEPNEGIFSKKPIVEGSMRIGNWKVNIESIPVFQADRDQSNSTWQKIWSGKFRVLIPYSSQETLEIGYSDSRIPFIKSHNEKISIGKWWTNHKVPAFLRKKVPVVFKEGSVIHEFLTGRTSLNQTKCSLNALRMTFSLCEY